MKGSEIFDSLLRNKRISADSPEVDAEVRRGIRVMRDTEERVDQLEATIAQHGTEAAARAMSDAVQQTVYTATLKALHDRIETLQAEIRRLTS